MIQQEVIRVVDSRHKRKFRIKFIVGGQESGCSYCIRENECGRWLHCVCIEVNREFTECVTPKKLHYSRK